MKYILALSLVFLGCAQSEKKSEAPVATALSADVGEEAEASNLTRVEAMERSNKIKNVEYELNVKLDLTADYIGTQKIRFDLSDANQDLRLDFFKGEVQSLTVNGQRAEVKRTPTTLALPKALLKTGANEVVLVYKTQMQTNGTGLSRFVDPEDGNIYLHTQFEAFSAHKFMPCFDQPDLKATMALTVSAPEKWVVVSTTREEKAPTAINGSKTWAFPKTAKLSTYLFSLHAGPYVSWEEQYRNIKLRLFARPALAKYVNHKLWFTSTKQGLGFYNVYFNYNYPFKKYDQLIVPNFNAGAMENAGAVTFSERFVSRGKVTRDNELNTTSAILHEMAHMWFGDLVTMKWWNDLWLNESFATYMAAFAMSEATPFQEVWRDFYQDSKLWAYYQDELSTTHPIEGNVKDTMDAFANFDGITYGKGASVMKQLNAWISEASFRKGVQDYFKTHQYGNAELKDFLASLQKFTSKDLTQWGDLWLRQPGVDTLTSNVKCEGGLLKSLTLDMKPSVPASPRPQTLQIGLFKKQGGDVTLLSKKQVTVQEATSTIKLGGACPDLVFVNYEDWAYAKVAMDEKSVHTVQESLSGLKDPLDRLMMWSNLWDMVRDQKLSLKAYAQTALKHLDKENDLKTLEKVVGTLSYNRWDDANAVVYWPVETPAQQKERTEFIGQLEKMYANRLAKAAPGSDLQMFWWDAYVNTAITPTALDAIIGALKDAAKAPKGMKIDQDRRWSIIYRACRRDRPECDTLLGAEKAADKSDRGVKAALAAAAVRPRLEDKKKIFFDVLNNPAISFHEKSALSRSLFPYEQRGLAATFEKDYFKFVQDHKNSDQVEFVEMVTGNLIPNNCSKGQSDKIQNFLKTTSDIPTPLFREIQETLDEDLRCQKIRAKAY